MEPGRTYHCHVKGRVIEVRVLESISPEFLPAPLDENDIMLEAWVELPRPTGGTLLRSKIGPLRPPDVPHIPADDDLS
jgi:hypothetical protein